MFGSDTTKQDLFLIISGIFGAVLFYWIFSFQHPLSVADSSLGNDQAKQMSQQVVTGLGYLPVQDSYADFRVRNEMLENVQRSGPVKEVYTDSEIRTNYPVFYWQIEHASEPEEWLQEMANYSEDLKEYQVFLSEKGEFLGFNNEDSIFPSRPFETEILELLFDGINHHLNDLRADAELFEQFQFRFVREPADHFEKIEFDPLSSNILDQRGAEKIAKYHLEKSGWRSESFEVESTELISINQVDAARVEFQKQVGAIDRTVTLTVDVLPTGSLVGMIFTDPGPPDTAAVGNNYRLGILAVVALLFILWLLILLYIRIKLRLIDTKLAVLVAVLAGFAFPALLFLNIFHQILYSFGTLAFSDLAPQIVGFGIIAALTSIVYFVITAIGDSLTREYWSEKLRTFDLIRIGHIYNRPVGLVIIRSVAFSFIIAGLWALTLYILPDSYIKVNQTFVSGQTLLPSVYSLMFTFFIFLGLTQIVFLVGISKISSYTKNPIVIGVIVAVIFMLITADTISVGPELSSMVLSALAGFALGLIFVKYDFLTTFLSLFLYGIHLLSSPGWVMSSSPDASIFYAVIALLVVFLAIGVTGVFRGKPINELPKYVPDYITEMARDERIKQELQIARTVQQSFLPSKTPEFPGLDIAAICIPAYETGGDYYDFININGGKIAVTIGDVSGKGIQAAFYMTFIKGILHALCAEQDSTVNVLAITNTLFRINAQNNTFISMIFGILDPENATFKFSRAGHNPLLYYNSESEKIEEFIPDGIGVGMTGEDLFRKHLSESTIKMKPGDIIVLFTDGIVEATSADDAFYGEERFYKMIKNNKNLPAAKIIKKLMDDLKNFGQSSSQHDDMTILIIKKE